MRARDARHPSDGLRFYGGLLLALLISGYILMKIIIYLTRIVAYYLLYGVWRFF